MTFTQLIDDLDWRENLLEVLSDESAMVLAKFLDSEYNSQVVYPPKNQIFTALNLTHFKDVKVVILGQDPYHGPGQAHGLAFSVKSPCSPPPSLKNIFKELGVKPSQGDLTAWAEQGVLLINTVFTVRRGQAHSHKNRGWEKISDVIIKQVSKKRDKVIFVLWGGLAAKKKNLIDEQKHTILTGPHPSPLSAYRGFFGCGHFDKINKQLQLWGEEVIDWTKGLSS